MCNFCSSLVIYFECSTNPGINDHPNMVHDFQPAVHFLVCPVVSDLTL